METARVSEILPEERSGLNVLVFGPTLGGKDLVAFDLLADTWSARRPPFVITATDTADQFRSRFGAFTPPERRVEDVYVIDCTEAGREENTTEPPTCTSATPADLTGIGICLSKGYDHYGTPGGRVVLLDNLSTLLVYSDVDRIFRFVSSINNRVTELGDTTVQLLDTDAIDTADRKTLLQVFSTLVEVREETGDTLFRVRGEAETDWYKRPARGETR